MMVTTAREFFSLHEKIMMSLIAFFVSFFANDFFFFDFFLHAGLELQRDYLEGKNERVSNSERTKIKNLHSKQ